MKKLVLVLMLLGKGIAFAPPVYAGLEEDLDREEEEDEEDEDYPLTGLEDEGAHNVSVTWALPSPSSKL